MAFCLLAGAGYALYQQSEARFRLDEGVDLEDPSVVSVELMATEVSNQMLQTSMSTITFFEGSTASNVLDVLARRVEAIRRANPWLGGIMAQKRTDAQPRLFYGPNIKTPGSFRASEAGGEVPLTFSSATPYHEYEESLAGFDWKVLTLPELIGSVKQPLWKVTLIPDAAEPDSKFALIVSMARVLGDAHTFYQLYQMLLNDEDEVESLNAIRVPEYEAELEQRLGANEASYINTSNAALWERPIGTSTTGPKKIEHHELLLFTISDEWLTQQRQAAIESAVGPLEQETAASLSTESIVLSWFFRDISEPTIGLVTKGNLRNFCACLGDMDAGNYQTPIPLVGPLDYATPQVVQEALATGKRSGTIPGIVASAIVENTAGEVTPPPPPATTTTTTPVESTPDPSQLVPPRIVPRPDQTSSITDDYSSTRSDLPHRFLTAGPNCTFGMGVDWTRFLPSTGSLQGLNGDIHQTRHLPLYLSTDLALIPPRLSALVVFRARPEALGALCWVSTVQDKLASKRIISSGIIQETFAVA